MNMPFYNPYHFVPVKKRTDCSHDLAVDEIRKGNVGAHSHERYDHERFSGRVVCRLTTESPVVIGAIQEESESSKQVMPFELEPRIPAIPASSLRGMLSSIVEAASNSALRVLDEKRSLSYRQPMHPDVILSAIGIIIETDKELQLRPLVLPTLKRKAGQYEVPLKFRKLFSKYAAMKVYVPGTQSGICYLNTKDGWDISGGSVAVTRDLRYPHKNTDFYVKEDGSPKIHKSEWQKLRNFEKSAYKRERVLNDELVIGQQSFGAIQHAGQPGCVRGYLRVLRCGDRNEGPRNDIPETKKHELFIPAPDDPNKQNDLVPIPQHVIDIFHALADERTFEKLDKDGKLKKDVTVMSLHPYHPVGTERNASATGKERYLIRLKPGDLVYFDVDENGDVNAISFSSIWRGSAGVVKDYFENVDEELLPFHTNRKTISPAELLFGFVQGDGAKNALAFKGKVRISHGLLDANAQKPYYLYQDKPRLLKILGSPKPPSPSLYFKHSQGYIPKKELQRLHPEPQGRKDYLRKETPVNSEPWRSRREQEHLLQKVRITPIDREKSFWFHIDFDNLSDWELGLLAFALKPNESYRHKLGMGKPLELGQVKIESAGIFLVNRKTRYSSEGFNAPRYACMWKDETLSANLVSAGYKAEADAQNHPEKFLREFDAVSSAFATSMDRDIQNALLLIGNPLSPTAAMHTPQMRVNGTIDDEYETFKWFVENDKNKKQYLKPIEIGKPFPQLEYIDVTSGGGGRPAGNPHRGGAQGQGGGRGNPYQGRFQGKGQGRRDERRGR